MAQQEVSAVHSAGASSSAEHAAAKPTTPSGDISKSTFNSMAEFKKKQPALYKAMMQGIAVQMCNQMHNQNELLKDEIRRGRQNS